MPRRSAMNCSRMLIAWVTASCCFQCVCEVVAGGQGVWVTGAEDTFAVLEEFFEKLGGPIWVAGIGDPVGQVVANTEGASMFRTEDASVVFHEFGEYLNGLPGASPSSQCEVPPDPWRHQL